MAKKIVKKIEIPVTTAPETQEPAPVNTEKQELESLYAEMKRLGIHSIGQVEVRISQCK